MEEEKDHIAYPSHLPRPTWSPLIVSFGITLIFWGLVTLYVLSIVGFISLAIGIYGWIMDMRTELKEIEAREKNINNNGESL